MCNYGAAHRNFRSFTSPNHRLFCDVEATPLPCLLESFLILFYNHTYIRQPPKMSVMYNLYIFSTSKSAIACAASITSLYTEHSKIKTIVRGTRSFVNMLLFEIDGHLLLSTQKKYSKGRTDRQYVHWYLIKHVSSST